MRRFLRITFACLFALLCRAVPAFAQDASDEGGGVSHGVDYVVGFLLMLLILIPVCKPSRPFG